MGGQDPAGELVLRALEAGTYFLRARNPGAEAQTEPLEFAIRVRLDNARNAEEGEEGETGTEDDQAGYDEG
mgnify:CR=1 FL=1